ncbi:MAG: recombination mediator RecR [Alphaproteobacteria bacterium]|nr:recombination mediator RecR [Alphaproteobacteria bacterium]
MNTKIEKLIKQFAKLPRVGGRAAQRITLALLQDKTGKSAALAAALIETAENIKPCSICGCLTDNDIRYSDTVSGYRCEFCNNASRANGQLCLVRDLGDVWTLEKSGVFRGRYHIVGGLLSAAMGTTPDDLNIDNLSARVKDENITEIIFALPNTVEGKTTQHFIMNNLRFEICDLKFTELASGVPLGGDLDYIDDGTLSIAFSGRKTI